MVKLIKDIEPRGVHSICVIAPFDKGLQKLAEQNYKLISLAENARLRLQEGEDTPVCRKGNLVLEDFVYIPRKGIYLSKFSPVMENASSAVSAHKNSKRFYLNEAQVEKVLENSILFIAPSDTGYPIDTNRFGEDGRTVFAFGTTNGVDIKRDEKDAKEYGDFLNNLGIEFLVISFNSSEDFPDKGPSYAGKIWFSGIFGFERAGGRRASYITDHFCWGGQLCAHNQRVRGVRYSPYGSSTDSCEAYTRQQIETALKATSLSGIKEPLLEELRRRFN